MIQAVSNALTGSAQIANGPATTTKIGYIALAYPPALPNPWGPSFITYLSWNSAYHVVGY